MATKLTTGFEKFANQQRELNPDITDAEIEQLWSQQPLNKRIASGIESAVITPARAIASVPEAVSAGYEKLDQFSRSGPNLKFDTRNMSPLWGPERTAYKQEQERIKSISPDTKQPAVAASEGIGPVASGEQYAQSLEKQSTPELKKSIKTQLAQADKIAKDPPPAASPEQVDRFKEERDRAYKMYSEAKDRNEWLQLAQVLGQAVTQFGAAQVGMRTGRPMTGIQIPGIDYEARTAQEQRLLESRLRDIGEEQTREQRLADRLKEEEREKERIGLERRRVELAEREAGRPKETTEAREIKREERKEQKAAQAAITNIKAALATLGVGNKKQKEKALESIDKNLSEANLPAETVNKIQELKEEPGWFEGGAWETKRKEVDALLQPAAVSATLPTAPSQKAEGVVTVIHKASGQARQYPANSPEAQRAKSDPEFEVK